MSSTNLLVFISYLPVFLPRLNGTNVHPTARAKGLIGILLLMAHNQSTTKSSYIHLFSVPQSFAPVSPPPHFYLLSGYSVTPNWPLFFHCCPLRDLFST